MMQQQMAMSRNINNPAMMQQMMQMQQMQQMQQAQMMAAQQQAQRGGPGAGPAAANPMAAAMGAGGNMNPAAAITTAEASKYRCGVMPGWAVSHS